MTVRRVNDVLQYKDDAGKLQTSGLVVAEPPASLRTGSPDTHERLRVDVGQTGFWLGREFRSFYELNAVAAETTINLRFVCPVEFILWQQTLSLDSGGRRIEVRTGATSGGTWTNLPTIGRNRMPSRPSPYYSGQAQLSVGGTFTGGTVVEVIRLRTADNQGAASSSTIGARQNDERGLPAGEYIISLGPIAGVTDTASGVYILEWEERP